MGRALARPILQGKPEMAQMLINLFALFLGVAVARAFILGVEQ